MLSLLFDRGGGVRWEVVGGREHQLEEGKGRKHGIVDVGSCFGRTSERKLIGSEGLI